MFRTVTLCLVISAIGVHLCATSRAGESEWTAGDFHQHTFFTDGSRTFAFVMENNNSFGLHWWANSEHGGAFPNDGFGHRWDDPNYYPTNPIIGDGAHVRMWRWQSLRDYSFPLVLQARATYPDRMIFQAFEWNVPGHEHCSLGIVPQEFSTNPNANALAEFEYKFDDHDTDVSGGAAQGWVKSALSGHAKAVEGARWLAANYADTAWIVLAHVERTGLWDVQSFRDLNNAAPTVAFGFESLPGHQNTAERGEYEPALQTVGDYTYGGCGIYAAQIGGLWDALLGEGRHWWLFTSSDFHDGTSDFFPGEYQKTWVYVNHTTDPHELVRGLRSGNSFVVEGDLITGMDFHAAEPQHTATMGGTLEVQRGQDVTITIRVLNPSLPNHHGDTPAVDHIDLITGRLTGYIQPNDPAYTNDTNPTTHAIKRFTSADWNVDGEWLEMSCALPIATDSYFRLRGTNLGLNVPNETDSEGNPLSDGLTWPNNADIAFADLWFYSNPIFIRVLPQVCRGDTNCDGQISYADINPFVQALGNQSAWQAAYPICPWQNCDINGDGVVSYADINPFVVLLGHLGACP